MPICIVAEKSSYYCPRCISRRQSQIQVVTGHTRVAEVAQNHGMQLEITVDERGPQDLRHSTHH
jgi:hypothetical protein